MVEISNESNREQSHGVVENPWHLLRQFTAARIGIGRAGISIPTQKSLEFQLAHAQARDAVHTTLDYDALALAVKQLSNDCSLLNEQPPFKLHSKAVDRMTYLQRPDLGRSLDDVSRDLLQQHQSKQRYDLALVIADGLSATAITENAVPFIRELAQMLSKQQADFSFAPISLVEQGRVAIGDDVGELLNAKAVLILIGERPGLSSPDSMGLYLTWAPQTGLTDERRNCISNVRKAGLSYADAARKLIYLFGEARRLQSSGVVIKDRSESERIDSTPIQTNFLLNSNKNETTTIDR